MEQSALMSSAEEQLKCFGHFLEQNDAKLSSLLAGAPHPSSYLPKRRLVQLNYAAGQEQLTLLRLLESDRLLNKTLLTFAHICTEIGELVVEAKCMHEQFLYMDDELCIVDVDGNATGTGTGTGTGNGTGSTAEDSAQQRNERVLLKMSGSISFLCKVNFLLQRCTVLVNNLLHQCGAFLGLEDNNSSLEFKFNDVYDSLADLLLQILIFDEILQLSNFRRFWPLYKKTIQMLAVKGAGVGGGGGGGGGGPLGDICSVAEVNALRNSLEELDVIFSGAIFRNLLDSTFALKEKIGPKGMGNLMQQFNEYVKQHLATLDKINFSDWSSFGEPLQLVRLNAFCVVFHDFCGHIETKHVKHLLELNAKHQGIILVGNVPWNATPFLRRHAETLVRTHEKLLHDSNRQRQHFLQVCLKTLPRDCRAHCTQIALWALGVRKAFSAGVFQLKIEQFKELATLLLLGLRYAGHISFVVKALINTHVALRTPMTKQTLLSVCKLIEMLRMIQSIFQQHNEAVGRVMQCVLQYLQYKILHSLAVSKKRITNSKLHDRNVDALAALKIAEKCMNGPSTNTRILVTKLAMNATNSHFRTLPAEQYEKFKLIMQRMEVLANFQRHLAEICDTSFMYWHQSMLTVYLKQVVERKLDFNTFQHLIEAADKCSETLHRLELGDLKLADIVRKTNFENVRTEIISNLCARIEIFLRLEVHSSLQLEQMSPFEQSINDYRELIEACPIVLNGRYVILKDHVENYLSAMFYNLTTISLHDWKTYEEMRHLANKRLLLHPVDDYLPNQTLEQGIDILEIMRNIHIFVLKYVYNMNSQIFVEQQSSNKHLDSIGIRHVANSLRTHGTGVINTTVNFTYQFLRQKFYTFSQFLYDEQIKSRLMKELRSYAERKQADSYPLYSYERADAFNKDIRKLGQTNEPQTYMDLFRKVITHVGNAMGYIRLVRSGCIHANYSASLYLPKFDEHLRFVETCKRLRLDEVTIAAAENFEVNISNLSKNFSDSTDYFKLLVEVFQPFFHNPHNVHLKNFFLIVPPLTLNYVQYMLSVKEKINKRDRQEAAVLFDDGFTIGLVYILKLLKQFGDFNALQWFTTVRERFDRERSKIAGMLADIQTASTASGSRGSSTAAGTAAAMQKSENEKLQQTLALTERRINAYQTEFNLLYYNLTSAKIFFQ